MKIKIKYLRPVEKLTKLEQGDWVDLRCAVDLALTKGTFYIIPLGVAMEIPSGYEAIVAPRSSTFKKYGLLQTNSIGVIDNSYCGDNDEWGLPVYATEDCVISRNTRICQFRIIENQPPIEFTEVEHLDNVDRGGFGSTGV